MSTAQPGSGQGKPNRNLLIGLAAIVIVIIVVIVILIVTNSGSGNGEAGAPTNETSTSSTVNTDRFKQVMGDLASLPNVDTFLDTDAIESLRDYTGSLSDATCYFSMNQEGQYSNNVVCGTLSKGWMIHGVQTDADGFKLLDGGQWVAMSSTPQGVRPDGTTIQQAG